jgi:hypothetical protein
MTDLIGAPTSAPTTPSQPSAAPAASPIVVASGLTASGLAALQRLVAETARWSQ